MAGIDPHSLIARVESLIGDFERRDYRFPLAVGVTVLSGFFGALVKAEDGLAFSGVRIEGRWQLATLVVIGLLIVLLLYVLWKEARQHAPFIPPVPGSRDQPASPSLPPAIKGLRPYDNRDRDLFPQLGRFMAIAHLADAIASDEFQVGILHGRMGVGKTSLLKAGVKPVLDRPDSDLLCVYSRLEGADFDRSIRSAVTGQVEGLTDEAASAELPLLLAAAIKASGRRRMVLFIDQFEQFFVHTRQADRPGHPLIRMISGLNRGGTRVKALLCVRGDYLDRLLELQRHTGPLHRGSQFTVHKFTPAEAAAVLERLAILSGSHFDPSFLKELSNELSDRLEGGVLPARLQIVAWRLAEHGRDFDRTALQQRGGLDGILDGYVRDALSLPPADRQLAVRILATLTRGSTGAGQMSAAELAAALGDGVSLEQLGDVLRYLARDDVQLLSCRVREDGDVYELAHEWLIRGVRALSDDFTAAQRQAGLLLEQRVNEWLGNHRSPGFMLGMRELGFIRANVRISGDDPLVEEKRELLHRSQRRARRVWMQRGGVLAAAVLAGGLLLTLPAPVRLVEGDDRADVHLSGGAVLLLRQVTSLRGVRAGGWDENQKIPAFVRRRVLDAAGQGHRAAEADRDSANWRMFLQSLADSTQERIVNQELAEFRLVFSRDSARDSVVWAFEGDIIRGRGVRRAAVVHEIHDEDGDKNDYAEVFVPSRLPMRRKT